VLVVDDDPAIRELLILALEREEYEVRWASNGQEALWVLTGWRPAAILLDPVMPVMDGRTFRAHQLADQSLAAIPVLALSAEGQLWDAGSALYGGPLVSKPFNLQAVLAALETLVRA
jgi:CheY-like chemotaxis protein